MTLRETFQTLSKAAIDAKLSIFEARNVKKEQYIVDYPNRLVELIGESEGPDHPDTMVDQKQMLLRGFSK